MGMWRRGLAVVAVGGLVVAGACVSDEGTPPGLRQAEVVDVNADGLAAVNASEPGWQAYTLDVGGEWAAIGSLTSGGASEAAGIDDAGTVVGTSWPEVPQGGTPTAFLYDADAGLRPLPGDWEGGAIATGISDNGLVVGLELPDGLPQGFVTDLATGEARTLVAPPEHVGSYPTAVNDAGTVAGYTFVPFLAYRAAVVWEPPAYEPELLPKLPGAELRDQQWPTGVDDDGTIVGAYFRPGPGMVEGARWEAANGYPLTVLPDIVPEDVEDGTLVGYSPGPDPQALWWGAGEPSPEPLGRLDGGQSSATALAGTRIAGYATTGPTGPRHAARFTPAS